MNHERLCFCLVVSLLSCLCEIFFVSFFVCRLSTRTTWSWRNGTNILTLSWLEKLSATLISQTSTPTTTSEPRRRLPVVFYSYLHFLFIICVVVPFCINVRCFCFLWDQFNNNHVSMDLQTNTDTKKKQYKQKQTNNCICGAETPGERLQDLEPPTANDITTFPPTSTTTYHQCYSAPGFIPLRTLLKPSHNVKLWTLLNHPLSKGHVTSPQRSADVILRMFAQNMGRTFS